MRATFAKSVGANTVGTVGAFAHPGQSSHLDMGDGPHDIELDTKTRFNVSEPDLERGVWKNGHDAQAI